MATSSSMMFTGIQTSTYTISNLDIPEVGVAEPLLNCEIKLKVWLEKIKKACENLPEEMSEKIAQATVEWETKIFQNNQLDSPDVALRIRAAYALCFFYDNYVEYTLTHIAKTVDEQLEWFRLGKELKLILAEVLPSNKSVDAVMQAYSTKCSKWVIMEQRRQIQESFQAIEDDLYRKANEANAYLLSTFENLKQELLKATEAQRLSAEEIHARLDAVTEKVAQIFRDFEKHFHDGKELLNRMVAQTKEMERQIDDVQNIIKEEQ